MKSSATQKMKSNPFHPPQRISSRSDFIRFPKGNGFNPDLRSAHDPFPVHCPLTTKKRPFRVFLKFYFLIFIALEKFGAMCDGDYELFLKLFAKLF